MAGKTPLVAGNWKMNGVGASLGELRAFKELLAQGPAPSAEIMVCPPATEFHKIYHTAIPRRVSGGYCKKCEKIITIIPIIYGAFNHEIANMLKAENNGKLIIGNINDIREGNKIAMFGCNICNTPLPEYGTM